MARQDSSAMAGTTISTGESSVEFESGGYALRGVVHRAEDAPPAAGIVFVHPFAEEKKCSHRVFVEAARAAAREGWSVLRFDLRGCGDSAGEFEEADLSAWRTDLRRAFAFAPEALETKRIGLLGLRLGATLAAELAEEELELPFLVLWEPVTEGERYVSLTMRRSMMRKKLTAHEGGDQPPEQEDGDDEAAEVDFDGYLVPPATQQQIAEIDLLADPKAYPGPTLVLNLSGRGKVAPAFEKLASLYVSGQAQVARQEPIWSTVGMVDPTPSINTTIEWLQSVLRPGKQNAEAP
jgi:exosortase A-associated hydrolase 2